MRTGRVLAAAFAAVLAVASAGPAGAAIVEIIEDGGNTVDLPPNSRSRATFDVEWSTFEQVEAKVTIEARDNAETMGFSGLQLNDSNLPWMSFNVLLSGAIWANASDTRMSNDEPGVVETATVNPAATLVNIMFVPDLPDRATLTLGNPVFPLFDPNGDLLIDVSNLMAGDMFRIFLRPNNLPDDGNGSGSGGGGGGGDGETIPTPSAWAMGLVLLSVVGGMRRRGRQAA